jgi:catechol 2,3-dioxygenase-like lactoylglutathione lyase family enzyme
MLGAASFIGFIPVSDLAVAREFYAARLGLAVRDESPTMLMLDAGGTMLWVTAVGGFSPQPFTIAGWRVLDIADSVQRLMSQGIAMLRYPELDQDSLGVWTAPGGNRVAWFDDPDQNVLSVTQLERAVVDEFWV